MRAINLIVLLGTLFVGQASPAVAQDKFFKSDDVRIRYVDQGSGEPVVLLHGNGGLIEFWVNTGVMPALGKSHRVIAMDLRGYGKSDKPHEPSAYGSRMGDDVVRLLDYLGVQKTHVVGFSLGARITSWLIVNHPARLISATLGASTYHVDSPTQREAWEALAQAAARGGPTAADIMRGNPSLTEAQATRFAAARAKLNDPHAIAAVYRGYPGLAITEEALGSTRVPVLHIVGSLDTARLPASRRLKETVLPSVEFVIVEGATHLGSSGLIRHSEFVDAVAGFLARNRAGQ